MSENNGFDWAAEMNPDRTGFSGYVIGPVRTAKTGEEVKAMIEQDTRLFDNASKLLEVARLVILAEMDKAGEDVFIKAEEWGLSDAYSGGEAWESLIIKRARAAVANVDKKEAPDAL